MNDETPTQKLPHDSSFEERLFARLDAMEASLRAEFKAELSEVKARLSIVESRLDNLEEKVDARLRETRPIWEGVLVRLDSIEEQLKSTDDKVDILTRYFQEMNKDMMGMRTRINKLEDIVLPPLS